MIISSSYSLLFHSYFQLQNFKSTTPFFLQPEENVPFSLGNQLGLGEQTNGDNTHFTLRDALQLYLRVCIIAMSLKWLVRCEARRWMIPTSLVVKRCTRYPKNWIPRRNLKEVDSLKIKIKSNETNYAFAWDYDQSVWSLWLPIFSFCPCPESLISVMNSIPIHMRNFQVSMTKYRKVLCKKKEKSFTKLQQFGHNAFWVIYFLFSG